MLAILRTGVEALATEQGLSKIKTLLRRWSCTRQYSANRQQLRAKFGEPAGLADWFEK